MKAYSLIIIICCIWRYASIEIKWELKKNILNFGYGINFKYKEMLAESFDRFYVDFYSTYHQWFKIFNNKFQWNVIIYKRKNGCSNEGKEYISNLRVYCKRIVPFVHYYRQQISAHNILTNKISLILQKLPKIRREKRCTITSLIIGFIVLAYEGISSFLHNRRHKTLHKAVKGMETKVNLQHNKHIHLQNYVVMYRVYNAESLEKLINTIHQMHNITIQNERLFTGTLSTAYTWYVNKNSVHHYAINLLLYLRTLREMYVKMYEEFIMQLHMYAKAIRILAKGYLPISLIFPSQLQENLTAVKEAIWTTNPDYEIVMKRLHLYYFMKSVTFAIDRDQNLIVQLPILIQPYM